MPENLDLVCSIFAAWERGDFRSVDWADPGIEWIIADGPTAGSWSGVAGMTRSFGGWLGAWDDFRLDAEEYRELDNERVLVLTTRSGRGKASGIELGQMSTKGAMLFHVSDGKVTKFVSHYDRECALADLGLKE